MRKAKVSTGARWSCQRHAVTMTSMKRFDLVIGILDTELSLELQLKADLTLENCLERIRNSKMLKKQNKGVDHVSLGGRPGRYNNGFKAESNKLQD